MLIHNVVRYVIDVSKQRDRLASSSVSTSINLTLNAALPNNAIAYTITYFDTLYSLKGDQLTNIF